MSEMYPRGTTRRNQALYEVLARRILLPLVVILLSVVSAPDAVAQQTFRISSVTIEGNQRIETGTILDQAGIEQGQTITAGELNDIGNRIRESGFFEDVEVEPRGGTLVIRVVEFPTINRIAFEGNTRIDDEDLAEFIESAPRQVFSPTQAERDVVTITRAYEQNGRVSARVTPKIIRRSENRVDLVFEIFEGAQIEIQRISFVGNRAYSDRRLRRVLQSKQAGLLRALIASDVFIAERLEFDAQLLNDFYQSRGYVDFRVTGTNAELTRERDGYFITFNVQEGQQFRFGEITTTSEMPEADPQVFQDVLKVKPGRVYSPTVVENSIARMERLATNEGIDFLRVEPAITRNDRDLTLDVEFQIVRGPRVFVERIDIEGNTTTLDRVIRRQFDTVEGDPFNPREIRQAAERIRALGYFANSDVNAREGSRPDQVIVDVDVEETTTGSLSFGGSFSSQDGLGLAIGFTERNFLGRGQQVRANIAATTETANFNLAFVEPAFLGRDVEFSIATGLFESGGANGSFYDTITGSFRPALGFPLDDTSRLSVYYNGEYREMSDYVGRSPTLAAETALGGSFSSALGGRYTFDTRRTGIDPDRGVLIDLGLEYAGIGGDQEYLQTSFRAVGQTLAFSEEVTLRASFEIGAREFLGGTPSRAVDRYTQQIMRGFDANGIGPSQADIFGREFLGGNYFAVAQFDAEFPLGLPNEFGITGGVFYDIGSVWGVDQAIGFVQSESFKPRQTIGISLFWNSPFGPLRINLSEPIQKEDGDITRQFDVQVRTDF
ncbi:MAG: outer membrane protein assembly factor BamA [Pseudomonadota bacterium]